MSAFLPSNSLGNFLDPTIFLSDEPKQFSYQMREAYYNIADTVNSREISYYPLQEILCGQFFFTSGNPLKFRSIFRKTFEIPATAAGATTNIAHGITGLQELTHIFGTLITDVVDYRPLPYASEAAANQSTSVKVVGANIVIINGAAAPNITSGIVVVEFTKA